MPLNCIAWVLPVSTCVCLCVRRIHRIHRHPAHFSPKGTDAGGRSPDARLGTGLGTGAALVLGSPSFPLPLPVLLPSKGIFDTLFVWIKHVPHLLSDIKSFSGRLGILLFAYNWHSLQATWLVPLCNKPATTN